VKILDDLTNLTHIDASSRQAMAVCLTDGSSETFWESGEEDKNRAKTLVVRIDEEATTPLLIAIHIDNQRDEGYRTSYVSIMPAPTKNQVKN
jgi:E3 ubiquitin-protein ligase MYCBP2